MRKPQIRLVKQPTESSCSQACIAMVTGKALRSVIKDLGTEVMQVSEVRAYLRKYDWGVSYLVPIGSGVPLPTLALLFISDERHDEFGHLALWYRGEIYDPGYGMQPDYPPYLKLGHFAHVSRYTNRPPYKVDAEEHFQLKKGSNVRTRIARSARQSSPLAPLPPASLSLRLDQQAMGSDLLHRPQRPGKGRAKGNRNRQPD